MMFFLKRISLSFAFILCQSFLRCYGVMFPKGHTVCLCVKWKMGTSHLPDCLLDYAALNSLFNVIGKVEELLSVAYSDMKWLDK